MPSQEPYLNLTLYDSVSDKTETFLNFRNAIAGTSDSNFIKVGNGYNTLDTQMKTNADSIEQIKTKLGILPIDGGTFFETYTEWVSDGGTF